MFGDIEGFVKAHALGAPMFMCVCVLEVQLGATCQLVVTDHVLPESLYHHSLLILM